MSKKLESFSSWLKSVFVAAIAIGAYGFRDFLSEEAKHSPWTYLALIVLVVILSKVSEYFIESYVSKSVSLRKFVLGEDFIEGWWIDKVIENGKVENVGFCKIFYNNGMYQISGDSCDTEGRRFGNFKTYISEYHDKSLRYAYHGMNDRKDDPSLDGYGEYHFSASQDAPISFTGFIYDTRHMSKVRVHASKVFVENLLKNIDTPAGRKKIIDLFLKEELIDYQKQIPHNKVLT